MIDDSGMPKGGPQHRRGPILAAVGFLLLALAVLIVISVARSH